MLKFLSEIIVILGLHKNANTSGSYKQLTEFIYSLYIIRQHQCNQMMVDKLKKWTTK